jgi:hypothetical protein
VIDYKSDVIDVGSAAAASQVNDHYALQARLYAIACARMARVGDARDHATRFGGLLYWFLRSQQIVHLLPSIEQLAEYQLDLGRAELA